MKKRRFSYSSKTVMTITFVLLALNIILGTLFIVQSRNSMRQIINDSMLGVAKTAGAMLDGDELASIKEADMGGEKHNAILDKLKIFANNFDFKYIYIVRPDKSGKCVFIADPDPKNPAEYGRENVSTPALVSAVSGKAAVDRVAVNDEWGKYYTAYCPVMTSQGGVGGIVGVDFDAEWYENHLSKNTAYIMFVGTVSLIIGGSMMLLITIRLRRKLNRINGEIESISADISSLLVEIDAEFDYALAVPKSDTGTGVSNKLVGIEKLYNEVDMIKEDLKRYIEYVHIKAYTDGMTGVGNKTAYLELVHSINDRISAGSISFAIAVFDVDWLKLVNDEYGHEMGDNLINGTAACIKNVFGAGNVYRIGGDEFIAVLENYSGADMEEAFSQLDEEIKRANAALPKGAKVPIAFSKGYAAFNPDTDKAFKEVFRRADKKLYVDKDEHHKLRNNIED